MGKTNRKTLLALFIPCVFVLSVILCCTYFIAAKDQNTPPETSIVSACYAVNISDPVELVGICHQVFTGTVAKKTSSVSDPYRGNPNWELPYQLYEVNVHQMIKGDLDETITVMQQGGEIDGEIWLMDGDEFLEEGCTYLFATRYDEKTDSYTLVPNYGDIKIDTLTRSSDIVAQYQQAYEASTDYDTAHGMDAPRGNRTASE